MENVQHHLHTHISPKTKKGKKREQGVSKLVQCVLCDVKVHARGLHSHMRQAHHMAIEKVTKVIDSPTIVKTTIDHSPTTGKHMQATGGDHSHVHSNNHSHPTGNDHSQTIKIIEEITTYKKVELVPGSRGGKIKKFRNCHRCGQPVELKMAFPENYMDPWDVKQRIVCEPCIKNYYEQEGSGRAHYVKDAYGKIVFARHLDK